MARLKMGVVISNKMAKTAVVEVLSVRRHPMYLKAVRRTKNFHVHDGVGVKIGDRVEFKETRPISRTKRWTIVGIVMSSGKRSKKTEAPFPKNESESPKVKKMVTPRTKKPARKERI